MNNSIKKIEKLRKRSQVFFDFLKVFLLREVGLIVTGILFYVMLITVFNHQYESSLMTGLVLLFAIVKVAYFLFFTLYRIENHLRQNTSSFYRCMASFGTITILLILSFSLDYLCLFDCNELAFSGTSSGAPLMILFFEFNYFSLVTFATIGFGDIVPLSIGAKLIVMLEITTSFFMVVFILSNFSKLRDLNKNN